MADSPATAPDKGPAPSEPNPQIAPTDTSPGTDAETITKAEAETLVERAVASALSQAGRTAKELEDNQSSLTADRTALDEERATWELERDRTDEIAVRDDPQGLQDLRSKVAQRQREREATQRERAVEAREAAAAERETNALRIEKVANATAVAQTEGVDSSILLEFGGDTEESMKKLAASLKANGNGAAPIPGFTPDSGRGAGADTITAENIDNLMMRIAEFPPESQKAIREKYRDVLTTGKFA